MPKTHKNENVFSASSEATKEDICPYCGCDVDDHPSVSIPLGSFTCCGCGGCPLTSEHVNKIIKWFSQSEVDELIYKNDLQHGKLYDDLRKRHKLHLDQLRKELKEMFKKYDWSSTQINAIIDDVFSAHNGLVESELLNRLSEGGNPSKPDNISFADMFGYGKDDKED